MCMEAYHTRLKPTIAREERRGFGMTESEVAAFRERQALQEQAARDGLDGLAVVGTHETVTARMQQGAEHILALFQAGRTAEAEAAMMSQNGWC